MPERAASGVAFGRETAAPHIGRMLGGVMSVCCSLLQSVAVCEPAAPHMCRTTGPTDYSQPVFPLFFHFSEIGSPLCLRPDLIQIQVRSQKLRRPISNRTSHFGRRPSSDRRCKQDAGRRRAICNCTSRGNVRSLSPQGHYFKKRVDSFC